MSFPTRLNGLRRIAAKVVRRLHRARFPAHIHDDIAKSRELAIRYGRGGPSGAVGLSPAHLEGRKTSDTLFILGSGESVNALSDEDWQHVADHDSLGINHWVLHPFTPTYLFFEYRNLPEGAKKDRYECLLKTLSLQAERLSETLLVANGRHSTGQDIRTAVQAVGRPICLTFPYQFRTGDHHLMVRLLRWWLREQFPQKRLSGTIHHHSTLSSAVSFGVLAGYKTIVLLGVDLHNTRYFWETPGATRTAGCIPPNTQDTRLHKTATAVGQPTKIPVHQWLGLFDQVVCQPKGPRIYVGSATSLLHPGFPVHRLPSPHCPECSM